MEDSKNRISLGQEIKWAGKRNGISLIVSVTNHDSKDSDVTVK